MYSCTAFEGEQKKQETSTFASFFVVVLFVFETVLRKFANPFFLGKNLEIHDEVMMTGVTPSIGSDGIPRASKKRWEK